MNWFVLAFISAVFSAISAVSEKKSLFSLNALDFSYIASVSTLVFTLPFFFYSDFSIVFTPAMLILFLKSMLGAAAYICVMLAVKNLEISEALPLLALTPGLTAVAGVIFISDSLTYAEWGGIIFMLSGAYVIEMHNGSSSLLDPFKALFRFSKYSYVFIALLLFTISSLLDRVLLKNYQLPPFTFVAFQQLFYVLMFLAVVSIKRKDPVNPFRALNKNLLYLVVVIAVSTVIYRYTQIEATKIAPVALVLSVKRLSVLLAVFFGGRLFKDKNLAVRIGALILILIGTFLLIK